MMYSTLYNCRNIIYTNCRRINFNALPKSNIRGFTKFKELKLTSVSSSQIPAIRRFLSTEPNTDPKNQPAYTPLMEYPQIIWPGLFQTIGCWLTFKFLLPSMDKDFDMNEFIDGSQQAVCVVSNALSGEDYESLEGLVSPEALEILKENISKLSDDEKKEIRLDKKEFFICFPSKVSVRPGTDGSSRIVEILMVYHILRGWKDPEDPSDLIRSNSGMHRLQMMQSMVASSEYLSQAIVCNYRFIREFGGSDKSWLINLVNHFKLSNI